MKESIRRILLVIFFSIFLISGSWLLWLLVIEPHINQKMYKDLKEIYVEAEEKSEEVAEDEKNHDLTKILEKNSDTVGWITIPNTVIDYPILAPPPNKDLFYLNHDFEKKASVYGAIFTDPIVDIFNENTKNIILHGHHMRNGTMFADILKFTNQNFCQNNRVITFNTLHENIKWEIFSVFRVNTVSKENEPDVFNYIVSEFDSDKKFIKFIKEVKSRSLFNIPVEVSEKDKILMLSTCSYEGQNDDDYRTIIAAKKMI